MPRAARGSGRSVKCLSRPGGSMFGMDQRINLTLRLPYYPWRYTLMPEVAVEFIPVILAGGSGERFWPLSRRAKPKQFLSLDGSGRSLLQATADRLEPLCDGLDSIHVVTSQMHRALILEQLPDLPLENLIVEPQARDTAAAILLATLRIAKTHGQDAILGVFPSDHNVGDLLEFQEKIRHAVSAASSSQVIVTIGMTPTFPATGYGYIEASSIEEATSLSVKRFVEKPNLETAENYLSRGGYYWNGGMFIFKASVMLEAFAKHAPDLLDALQNVITFKELKLAFEKVHKISIDYAILEPASLEDGVIVVPAQFEWDDLGDWNALARLLQGDHPNLAVGSHIGLDTSGAIMYTTTGDDLIVTLGLEDVLIVRDGAVTLVAHKGRTQDIKKLVERLRAEPNLERFT
jgi:mannose-1-phosphate guanylyltransferase